MSRRLTKEILRDLMDRRLLSTRSAMTVYRDAKLWLVEDGLSWTTFDRLASKLYPFVSFLDNDKDKTMSSSVSPVSL